MNVIDFAKKRFAEELEAENDNLIKYWVAYLDGARAQKREDDRKNETKGTHENK